MILSGVAAGIVPLIFLAGAVAARLAEHAIIDGIPRDTEASNLDRVLVEALSVAGQVLVVAAGVALGLTWAPR